MEDTAGKSWTAVKIITVAYFAIAITEVMAEFINYSPVILVFKPLMPITLMILYWFASDQRHPLFFLAMTFSTITNLLFIPNDAAMLFLGLIAFTVHRVFVLAFIFKLVRISDYIPLVIATMPFLLVFFYLLASSDVSTDTFIILCVQNVLISLLGGVALSNYIMADNRKNSWLLICGLLFVALQFIVFIEKYYLAYLSPVILRPVAMGLNAFAFYTFYEFVMAIEKSDDNGTPA